MLQNLKASVTSGGAVTGGAGGAGVVSGTVVDPHHHPLSPTNAPINPLSATQVDGGYAHYRKKNIRQEFTVGYLLFWVGTSYVIG